MKMSYNYTMHGRLCVTFVSNTRFGFNRHGGWFGNFAMMFMFNLLEAFLQVNTVVAYYFTMLIYHSVVPVILISFYNSTFFPNILIMIIVPYITVFFDFR